MKEKTTGCAVGASSACFYPLETEASLERVAKLGFKDVEVFFNTPCEICDSCFDRVLELKKEYGLNIVSVHPFLSFAEGFCFFSNYRRRYEDFLDKYKSVFEACGELGARYFVLHGVSTQAKSGIGDSEYCERFGEINRQANAFGVTVAQENIVHYRSESPEFLLYMKQQLGDSFHSVLDIKQAHRAGYLPEAFIESLGDSIVHVHVSDSLPGYDCLPPGEGEFDFGSFFRKIESAGYNGKYIIELYNNNFSDDNQLIAAADYLKNKLAQIHKS